MHIGETPPPPFREQNMLLKGTQMEPQEDTWSTMTELHSIFKDYPDTNPTLAVGGTVQRTVNLSIRLHLDIEGCCNAFSTLYLLSTVTDYCLSIFLCCFSTCRRSVCNHKESICEKSVCHSTDYLEVLGEQTFRCVIIFFFLG